MASRNIPSIVRTLSSLNASGKVPPSAKANGLKVLRQLGVIKPQRRTGVAAQLRKLIK